MSFEKRLLADLGKFTFWGVGFFFSDNEKKISLANLLKFETFLGFRWSYNTLLLVLGASGTSVACYEAPHFVDFTLFSRGLELVQCTLIVKVGDGGFHYRGRPPCQYLPGVSGLTPK